jgi:TonB family protein
LDVNRCRSGSNTVWSTNKNKGLAHGMWRLSRARYLAACCSILLQSYATASPDGAPHPTADFPRAESFYPHAAKLWAQEGTTVVHYCVDANGHLSGDPTVERTSGDEDLDGAALALAKAGDDHYVPAYAAGKATAGCAKLNVQFALADDPAFPTLSRRAKQLTNASRPQVQSLQRELQLAQRPPDLTAFVAGDRQQLMQLRDFVAGATPLVKQYDTLLADFVSKMDELGRADDVSEAERTAFSKSWQENRTRIEQLRASALDMRAVLTAVNEFADYVESAQPPQRAELDELIARARAEYDQLQTKAPPQSVPLLVESVAGLEYSAATMPGVVSPVKITSAKEIANSCQYPPTANRNFAEGTTQLRLHLDATGAVSAAAVARSSGYDELDAAALKCIATVRFRPASQDDKPVAAVVRYGWTWKIDWGAPDPNKCADLKAAAEAHPHPPANDPAAKPTAMLCTCWEESGKSRGPQLVESTGSQRLDDGAIKLALATALTPRPPGHAGCSAYRMQFELQNPAPRK